MSEIRNLTRNGETFYPLTTSSAVINESTGEGLVIDDEPSAGSNNLVKSGGVKIDISDINVKINTGGTLSYILSDFSPSGLIPANNVAIGEISRETLSKYKKYVVTPKTGYKLGLLGSRNESLSDGGISVFLAYDTVSIDIIEQISQESRLSYITFGIIAKKLTNNEIYTGEFEDIAEYSIKEKIISSDVEYDNSGIATELNNVGDALDEIYEILRKENPTLNFTNRDTASVGFRDAANRAVAYFSSDYVIEYSKFVISANTGYLMGVLGWTGDPETHTAHVFSAYGEVTEQDYTQLSGYQYYGVILKRTDNGNISPSDFGSLVSLEVTKNEEKTVYVATNGSDINTGTSESPFSTITKALSESNNIVIKGGQYDINTINLSNYGHKNICISSVVGDEVILMNRNIYINDGSEVTVSGYTNVYSKAMNAPSTDWIYQHLIDNVNTAIQVSDSSPLQRGKHYRCDCTRISKLSYGDGTPYATLADALLFIEGEFSSHNYYYVYDTNNGVMYFTRPQLSSSSHPICGSKTNYCFITTDTISVKITGINFYYGGVDLHNVIDSEVANCASKYTYGWGCFHWLDCKNLKFVNCEAAEDLYGSYGDGFNGDSTIMTVDPYASSVHLIDCWAHDNNDDGYSDHGGCNCNLIGGLYEYNQKGGVTPAAGSHCTAIGVISRNNINGFYYIVSKSDQGVAGNSVFNDCLAEDNSECGFRCEGGSNTSVCINCISLNNTTYGYIGAITAYNCKANNNAIGNKGPNVIVKTLQDLT